jgi:nucleoid-associated protein YgaU
MAEKKLATSSKLKKAYIQVLDAQGKVKEEVSVLFNPSEYTMEKSNEFASINIPGLESPMLQFSRGNMETLTMDLFFDSYEENKDVRDYTGKITDLLKIDPKIHAPPVLKFVWGSLNFTCVLSRVTKKFTLFRSDGKPVRATLTVTFNEYRTEISSRERHLESSDRTKTYVIKEGDSLWAIAAREYGDPAFWRPIADENRIENPRLLEIGKEISIPPLE